MPHFVQALCWLVRFANSEQSHAPSVCVRITATLKSVFSEFLFKGSHTLNMHKMNRKYFVFIKIVHLYDVTIHLIKVQKKLFVIVTNHLTRNQFYLLKMRF